MLRVLLAILTGLVGAALLHLVIIFSLPSFSERDAHSQVMNEGPEFRFHIVGAKPDRAGLAKQDPFLEIAVCAFDITDQPVAPDLCQWRAVLVHGDLRQCLQRDLQYQ